MVLRKMSVLDGHGHVEKFLGIPDQTDEYRKDERKVKREERAFLKKVEEVWGNSMGRDMSRSSYSTGRDRCRVI